jgi:PAS domain S-box-containing protein
MAKKQKTAVPSSASFSSERSGAKIDNDLLAFRMAKTFIEVTHIGIWMIDENSRTTFVNQSLADMLGYRSEEMIGRKATEFMLPEDSSEHQKLMDARREGFTGQFERSLSCKDGHRLWVSVVAMDIADEQKQFAGSFALISDITEKKRLEFELREEKARVDSILRASPVGIGMTVRRIFAEVNDYLCRMLGYSREELLGKSSRMLYLSQESYDFVGREKYGQIEKFGIGTVETQWVARDGRILDILLSSAPLVPGDPDCGVTFIAVDITERKRTERERNQLFDHSLDMLAVAGFDGYFKQINPAWTEILGWSKEELYSRPWLDFVYADDRPATVRSGELLSRGEAVLGFENRYRCKDGTLRWLTWNSFPSIKDKTIFAVARDTTLRRRTEEELRTNQQKFASIFGSMTEMVALHEVIREGSGRIIDYRILDCNPAYIRATGIPREKAIGAKGSQLYGWSEPPYLKEFSDVVESGKPLEFETYFPPMKKHFQISVVSPGRDQFVTVTTDITERRTIEAQHQRTQAMLEAAVAQSPAGILIADAPDVKIRWANAAALGIRGKTNIPLTGIDVSHHSVNWQTFRLDGTPYPPEKLPLSRAILEGEITRDEEVIIRNEHGEDRWVSVNAAPIRDRNGVITSGIVVFQDITERKLAEGTLRLNAQRMDALLRLNQMSDASLQEITDFVLEEGVRLTESQIGYLAFLNEDESVLTMHSWSKNAMAECAIVNKPIHYPVADTGLWGEAVRQRKPVITNDYNASNVLKKGCPAGHVRLLRHMNTPIFAGGRIVAVAGVGNKNLPYNQGDVVQLALLMEGMWSLLERRRVAEALRESEENYRRIFNSTSDALFIHDKAGRILDVNERMCAMFGYDRETAMKLTMGDLSYGDNAGSQSEAETRVRRAFEDGPQIFEWPCRRANGELFWCEVALHAGEIAGRKRVIASVRDITERKRAQEALVKMQFCVDRASIPVFWIDRDARINYANDAACQSLGYSREELLTLGAPDIDPDMPASNWSAHMEEMRRKKTMMFAMRHHRKDGTVFPVEITSNYIDFGGQEYIFGFAQDISERVQAEQQRREIEAQMQHSQKLESLGVMAGGIAHDFNNLLTAILGNASLALHEISPESPGRESLEEIEKVAGRAAELCRQMLAYSGRGRFAVEPLDLSHLVEEMAHMLSVSVSKKISLQYQPGKDLPAVEADATQLRQVVMNLIVNANEAIGEKEGAIRVSTGVMHCDGEFFRQTWLREDLPEGQYVYLEVEDSGCGMDEKTRSRIFEPFFTTKFTGRGLGLAAVLGIVRGHHGAIHLHSEAGRGTRFRVVLPASPRKPVEAKSAAEKESRMWRGKGTILVVDDEETIRVLLQRMLEQAGFETLAAVDGREAVDVFRKNADKIVCVLLDLTMPHLDGVETFQEIRRIQPGAVVILSSGYDETDAMQRFSGLGLAGFLQKPYQYQTLIARLRKVLEADA